MRYLSCQSLHIHVIHTYIHSIYIHITYKIYARLLFLPTYPTYNNDDNNHNQMFILLPLTKWRERKRREGEEKAKRRKKKESSKGEETNIHTKYTEQLFLGFALAVPLTELPPFNI